MAEIAQENGIYLHIDGAYGAPFVLSEMGNLFNGIEKSNSLVVDAHKYLYTPYQAGTILFRNSEEHSMIENTNSDGNEYMFKEDEAHKKALAFKEQSMTHLGKRRLEGSMGGQGAASIWAVIHTLGKRGLGLLLNHTIQVTRDVYDNINNSPIFTPAYKPELNTLCFYPKPGLIEDLAEQNNLVETCCAILEQKIGAYLSTTTLDVPSEDGTRTPMKVFRFVTTHPYTDSEDALRILDELHRIWSELTKTPYAIK